MVSRPEGFNVDEGFCTMVETELTLIHSAKTQFDGAKAVFIPII